jgi:hypothetical protein
MADTDASGIVDKPVQVKLVLLGELRTYLCFKEHVTMSWPQVPR